jgi:hypothetical protein
VTPDGEAGNVVTVRAHQTTKGLVFYVWPVEEFNELASSVVVEQLEDGGDAARLARPLGVCLVFVNQTLGFGWHCFPLLLSPLPLETRKPPSPKAEGLRVATRGQWRNG